MIDYIKELLAASPMFQGGLVLMVITWLGYQLRQIPTKIWFQVRSRLIATVDVQSTDRLFVCVLRYVETLPYTKKSRSLSASTVYKDDRDVVMFSPSPGSHFFWYKGVPVWFSREREKSKDGGTFAMYESLTIRSVTKLGMRVITRLLEDSLTFVEEQHNDKTRIFVHNNNSWSMRNAKVRRRASSVVLADGVMEGLLDDVRGFIADRDWYLEQGVPWHRTYLFHGEPGTGKSSTVLALAGELGFRVYIISLAELDDQLLMFLLQGIEPSSFVLMEDIDCASAATDRRRPGDKHGFLTMSGLFNAIDGVGSVDGTILVMTSNYPGRLDEALTRKGRVDRPVYFGKADRVRARRMFEKFYPDSDLGEEFASGLPDLVEPARLQELFIRNKENPDGAIAGIGDIYAEDAFRESERLATPRPLEIDVEAFRRL